MKRSGGRSLERRVELIELAVALARQEYEDGKRSASSWAEFQRRAARDLSALRALVAGRYRRRAN